VSAFTGFIYKSLRCVKGDIPYFNGKFVKRSFDAGLYSADTNTAPPVVDDIYMKIMKKYFDK
jgi:hypothetical protein